MIVCQHDNDSNKFTVILEDVGGYKEAEMFATFAGSVNSAMRESYLSVVLFDGIRSMHKRCKDELA